MTLRLALVLTPSLLLLAGCATSREATASATASPEQAQRQPSALAGTWEGQVELPGQPLAFVARLAADGTGTTDVPQQGAHGLPLKVTREEGAEFELLNEIPGADAVLVGRREGDTLRGTFSQRGYSFPFTLKRATAAQ